MKQGVKNAREGRKILSVDFGTSSVKGLCISQDGARSKYKAEYGGKEAGDLYAAFLDMLADVLRDCGAQEICAVGLTSQAGTYILACGEGDSVTLPWNMAGGEAYVERIDELISREEFLCCTGSYSPRASSYPAPRALQAQAQYPQIWQRTQKYLQPKDYVYHRLTGRYYTDKYLWRGLASLSKNKFEERLLERLGIRADMLPELAGSFEAPASVSKEAAAQTGIAEGTPVFLGLNDYFASLMGMGITAVGDAFDITGTSEHIGCLAPELSYAPEIMSGPYINNYVRYGVTASSGRSIRWGGELFGMKLRDIRERIEARAPIFLPYVGGERAPIWDSNARGVFFGIDESHGKEDMSYAVFEGVVFSLYHIWSYLGIEGGGAVRVSGGGADNTALCCMKATMLGRELHIVSETETTALGAAMCAAIGMGWFSSPAEAAGEWSGIKAIVRPEPSLRPLLMERFEKYLEILSAVRGLW